MAETVPLSGPPAFQKNTSVIQASYTVKQFHDLLNGFVKNPTLDTIKRLDNDDDQKTILDCVDECLECIDKTWDDKSITTKSAAHVKHILSKEIPDANDALTTYYNDVIIYDELLAMALKAKEMNFVIKKEKMIYIPENWHDDEIETIKNKLSMTYDGTKTSEFVGKRQPSSKMAQFNLSDDVFAYVLRDNTLRSQNELPRTATILSDTAKRKIAFDAGEIIRGAQDLGNKVVNAIGLGEEKYQDIEMVKGGNTLNKTQDNIVICAGCRQRFNMKQGKYAESSLCIRAEVMDADEWFCFHDKYCVTLRKLKESIRRYALMETLKKDETDDVRTVYSYVMDLLENYEYLITVEKHHALPKPFEGKDEETIAKEFMQLNRTHVHQLRMRFDKSKSERTKSSHFPKSIKFANTMIYGESLAIFVINQLSAKQSDALWLILGYIMQQIPTTTALTILNKYRLKLLKVQKVDNLEMVLSSVVQSSTYNVATALYISAYIREAGEQDISRSLHWFELAEKYVDIALQLANSIESDHLLSLLLEIPTNIAQQSVFQIAIKYKIIDFLDNARCQRLLAHLWSEFDFLNPHKNFRTNEIEFPELLHRLMTKPNQFYYCPVGGYWIDSVMYLVNVLVVTVVAYQGIHDLTKMPTVFEWIMWSFSLGYLLAEISQFAFYGRGYLESIGNLMDIWILGNWIVIAGLRFHCVIDTENSCDGHDAPHVVAHMFFFGCQVVVLWSRIALIFRTSRTLGPFIAMLPGMILDIIVWAFVLSIFFLGFGYGCHFIIAGNIPELDTYESVFEYVFFTLLGQSDWTYLEPNDNLDFYRSLMLKFLMWSFAVVGTILLVNLLIAMMASTYEHLREDKTKWVHFARATQIYTSAYRYAIIPPPLNIIVYIICVFWMILEILVLFCSCRHLVINLRHFDPISVDYHTAAQEMNANANPPGIKDLEKCCKICISLSPERSKRIFCSTDNHKRSAKYCRFCRCYMRDSLTGSLKYYFSLFRNYRLDSRDKKYLIALNQPNGVCPECFRPFLKLRNRIPTESIYATDRLNRSIVSIEMISFWVFMMLMYIPLIIIIAVPAGFGACYRKIGRMRTIQISKHNKTILVRDDEFTRVAEGIIAEEASEIQQLQNDLELLRQQVDATLKAKQSTKPLNTMVFSQQNTTRGRVSGGLHQHHQSILSQLIEDQDIDAALGILDEIQTEHRLGFQENKHTDVNMKVMENELEELMINKQLREGKREDMDLMKRKYDVQESSYKLKIQILLKNDDAKNDQLINRLQGKLNGVRGKKERLQQELTKQERAFKFEDTQHDETMNDIKNKLEKLKNLLTSNQKMDDEEKMEEDQSQLIQDILNTTNISDDELYSDDEDNQQQEKR